MLKTVDFVDATQFLDSLSTIEGDLRGNRLVMWQTLPSQPENTFPEATLHGLTSNGF